MTEEVTEAASEEVQVVHINGVSVAVDNLTDSDKHMVNCFVTWNTKEQETHNELLMVQAAKRDVQRELNARVEVLRGEGKVIEPEAPPAEGEVV